MPTLPPRLEDEDLIAKIYQGPLESPPWQSLLHTLRLQLHSFAAVMTLNFPLTNPNVKVIGDADSDFDGLDVFRQHCSTLEPFDVPGTVTTTQSYFPASTLESTAFYREFMQPHDMMDGIKFGVTEPEGMSVWMYFARNGNDEYFGDEEIEFCRRLLPHIERSLELYSRLVSSNTERDLYRQAVENLSLGALILDDEKNVLKINSAANQIIQRNPMLDVSNRQLLLHNSSDAAQLKTIIHQCLSARENPSVCSQAEAMRLDHLGENPLGLLVKAIPPSNWHQGAGSPSLVIYLSDPHQRHLPPPVLVAKLFDLTSAEATLAVLLSDGLSLVEAAHKLNISENTARTQSKRIFAKTGVKRQAGLVRLILNSVALLG